MPRVNVVGAGPAGLMAADIMSAAGVRVTVYERMPSVGRKLLMAGRGGLNLTHSEPLEALLTRYGAAHGVLSPVISAFPPDALRVMAHELGQETFIGSSGRVFPRAMKASPLLRAWLGRLAGQGVEVRTRRHLVGLEPPQRLQIAGEAGTSEWVEADATVLALGGGSWPRLGSDGAWVSLLRDLGVAVAPLQAANVGAEIHWSPHFRERFAGEPLKRIAVVVGEKTLRGEAVVTAKGLEGGVLYAMTPDLRAALARSSDGAKLAIDLRPDLSLAEMSQRLARPRGKQSVASWLRKSLQLAPVAIGLLREAFAAELPAEPLRLAAAIKSVPLQVAGLGALDRAISSAGGISLADLDADMMVRRHPGLFVAGEMLDWEAPTGGYLLQGCFSTGHAAGRGALKYLGV